MDSRICGEFRAHVTSAAKKCVRFLQRDRTRSYDSRSSLIPRRGGGDGSVRAMTVNAPSAYASALAVNSARGYVYFTAVACARATKRMEYRWQAKTKSVRAAAGGDSRIAMAGLGRRRLRKSASS